MLLTQEYQEVWTSSKKAFFKFVFTYFSLYIFLMFSNSLFERPFRWVGKIILGIDYGYDVNGFGSGDHTYAYVTLFVNVVLAIVIAILWILLGHKRKSHNKLMYWFITLLRIFLVFFMFTYGFVKIIQLQFPYPSLTRMLEPLGSFSPMGLAWTYLGYSKGYNLFMGIMEISGGLLLIPKRTSTLGAFITFGVMMHVAVMNFMFDIPVKIFSIHLALMAFFIFGTDIKRFINVFIKNKPTESYGFYNPIKDKAYHKFILWLKVFCVVVVSGLFLIQGWGEDRGKIRGDKPYMYGVWEVSKFVKNGQELPPIITSTQRWRYLIIEQKELATVKTMDKKEHQYQFILDSITYRAQLYGAERKFDTPNFDYELIDENTLKLQGILHENKYDILLKRKDLLLYSRRFNWINERPYNR